MKTDSPNSAFAASRRFAWLRHSLCVLACGLAMLPSFLSAELLPPNGFYKPTALSASVRAAGTTYQLPLKALRDALLKRGVIVIKDRRMTVQRDKWGRVLQDFGFLGIRGDALVNGPSDVFFKKASSGFSARSSTPLVVKMKGRYKWLPVKMYLYTHLDSKIEKGRFVMHAPVRINVIGITLKGYIHLEAKRMEPPYDFNIPAGT